MNKTADLANLVSRSIGFRAHASCPNKVFSYTSGRSEVLFSVLALKGQRGRPRKGSTSGYGANTVVAIKVLGSRGKKVLRRTVVDLSELVNKNVTYLGTHEAVFGV